MSKTIAFLLLLLPSISGFVLAEPPIHYPETRKGDVVDEYHGVRVPDPYRWLEDLDSDETAAWVRAQNKVTSAFLATIPERERIESRLRELWNCEMHTTVFPMGGWYVYTKNDGLQNQDIVYVQRDWDDEPRILFDPNTGSAEGTSALENLAISPDGRYALLGISESGSDWQTFRIREIESGNDLPEVLEWIKFAPAAWSGDSRGFYYARFDAPEEGATYEQLNQGMKVYYHLLGSAQEEDRLVYARPDAPELGFTPTVTDDGRYLLIEANQGSNRKGNFYIIDLSEEEPEVAHLAGDFDAAYTFVGNRGSRFLFITDRDAPNGRLVEIDRGDPSEEAWRELITESDAILVEAKITGGRIVLSAISDVKSRITLHDLEGNHVGDVELPTMGTVGPSGVHRSLRWKGAIGAVPEGKEFFYSFTSFLYPTTVYRYDLEAGEAAPLWVPEVDFDISRFETEQVFYPSADGTMIPMFIVHRKGLERTGDHPVYIYAYGGFRISMTPYYKVSNLVWLEMGGVYALANLRGGSEYGVEWHAAGSLENKQNGFDDYIAAAEYMIREGYTTAEKIAIHGASNGGLMTAACMNQRPDLFGGVIVDVGVLDMLRFHKWTIGWAWVSDYGSSDDPAQFPYLYEYSPLHNIRPGAEYPATLIITADHDDRVVPCHSFKYAAALQEAQAGPEPVLIRIETEAGHGGGMPTTKKIEEARDIWAFLLKVLGMSGEGR